MFMPGRSQHNAQWSPLTETRIVRYVWVIAGLWMECVTSPPSFGVVASTSSLVSVLFLAFPDAHSRGQVKALDLYVIRPVCVGSQIVNIPCHRFGPSGLLL
jgi:hypothetical protein